jgi:hypothetical protein
MAEINEFLSPKAEKQVEKYQKAIKDIANQYGVMAKSATTLERALNKEQKTTKTLNTRQKEAQKLRNGLRSTMAKQEQASSRLNKELIKQKVALQEQTKALREQARQELGLKKRTTLFQGMTKSILAAGAAMFGLVAIFRTLKNAGKLVRDFQKENAVLAGVLNKTRKEISALTDDAKRLGSTTAKTAKEVTSLQIAYARLGFTQEEILDLTGDTINGSIALNAELSETAELTGAMVRSFDDLSTTDADDILDQLTMSTQKTALNFQKLQTALPIVAGAASAAGVKFETVVAQLGQAADRGIDASTAATSLRNIYLELAKNGLTLEDALKRINTSQDKLNEANKLFGKRAAVTALTLASTTDKTKQLEISLRNAGGTAEKVAREQLNTLDGSIQLLTSAWQGFILSIEEGDGAIAKFVNGTLRTFADALIQLSNLDLIFTRTSKLTVDQIKRTYDALIGLNNEQGENFRKFVDAFDDVSSEWLEKNRSVAEKYLKDLDFSNKEAQLLYEEHLKRIKRQEANAEIAASKATKKTIDASNKAKEEEIKFTEEEIKAQEEWIRRAQAYHDTRIELNKNLYRKEDQQWETKEKRRSEKEKAAREKELQDIEDFEATKQALQSATFNQAVDFVNALSALSTARRNAELSAINEDYDKRIAAAEGNSERQEQLEKERSKKTYEIELEQAKADKRIAAFNVVVSGALALAQAQLAAQVLAVEATANPLLAPLVPLAFAQVGLIAATTGVQLAAIAAQPLPVAPQFAKGTSNTPSTFIAGEAGRELIVDKQGNAFLTPDSATLYTDMAGREVLPNAQTERILAAANIAASEGMSSERIENKLDDVVKAIEKSSTYVSVNSQEMRIKAYNKRRNRMLNR